MGCGITKEKIESEILILQLTRSEIKQESPGGYILFGRDFENKTKESIWNELNECQLNSKIKLIPRPIIPAQKIVANIVYHELISINKLPK